MGKIFNGKIIIEVDLEEYEKAQGSYRNALVFMRDEKFTPSWRPFLNVAIVWTKVLQREVDQIRLKKA